MFQSGQQHEVLRTEVSGRMLDRKRLWALHALNVGTLAGIGVATWMSKGSLAFCPEGSDRAQLIIYGGLVGSVVYKALHSGISWFLTFLCYYVRLFEAHVLLKARLVDDHEFRALVRHLIVRHFGLNDNCKLTKRTTKSNLIGEGTSDGWSRSSAKSERC